MADNSVFIIDIYITQISGDYSGGVTPLPFPNRVVKPTSADGTAPMSEAGE
jgi:hypothetical protein